eukprot:TRINITY_DN4882_c0_g1_i2.p1 TRINITY_DN4882_c0_g1~~TRINITY_DN4882_c0_g1_i2.p1  ORF type:complete len:118 (-),score=9.44 TRINITY_DN4882_c0_g1_i2:128-481(-)
MFDQGLMSVGNLGFMAGITMTAGPAKIFTIFKEGNIFGTASFFFGFFLVLLKGWAWLGMLIELFGFINIFRSFFPLILTCARYVPILGSFLSLPGIDSVVSYFENQLPQSQAPPQSH